MEEYIDHVGWEYASARDFSDKYMGKYNSEGDFMEELAAETMEIPENLWRYIDFEKMAVDYFIDDFFMTESGYVFRRF